MKNLAQIAAGVKAWTAKMSTKNWDDLFGTKIQIPITSQLPMDSSNSVVNVYLTLMDNVLQAVCIQSSFDSDANYETALGRDFALSKMIILPCTAWTGVPGSSTTIDPTTNEITEAKAKERTDLFAVKAQRNNAKAYNGTGPIMFQIPAENFALDGSKTLYFGLKVWTESSVTITHYDMILSNLPSTTGAIRKYYNASRPMPPALGTLWNYGLEKYSKL